MNIRKIVYGLLAFSVTLGTYVFVKNHAPAPGNVKNRFLIQEGEEEDESGGNMERQNGRDRAAWEFNLLRDPRTGKIPDHIRAEEIAFAKRMPIRGGRSVSGIQSLNGTEVANNYVAVGPTQNAGRTRTLAFDKRYNGTSNKVIISGGINGGIFRSTDGGATWAFVHPQDEIRSVSCLAQDPRAGHEDTWYAGTGEAIGVSAAYPNAFVFGNGILKSIDNGATWTMLSSTADNNPAQFSQFDVVHRLAVHPVTGDIYAAIQRRIVRSQDGGLTWSSVLEGTTPTTTDGGVGEIIINSAGTKLYAAITGRNPDRSLVGIYTSSTGNLNAWTRIAGGTNGNVDSVAGWPAYDNSQTNTDGSFSSGWGRIVLSLAPSNQNLLYALIENGNSASANKPEAELFKADLGANTWTRLSDNLTATRTVTTTNTTKYFEGQGGYDMCIGIHPTNPNLVFVGGVNLFRSTDGFATSTSVSFVGGLSSSTFTDSNGASHPDMHYVVFDPSTPNRMITCMDGGLAETLDATATKITWNLFNSQLQTFQYYHVNIDPTTGSTMFTGGAQDNSTSLRDIFGLLGSSLPDSNDHYILLGGDGGMAAITQKNASGKQFLFCSAQNAQAYRLRLFTPFDNTSLTSIKPANTGNGEFVTYYHVDPDNTDYIYFPVSDTLYRSSSSTTVTTSGWTRMDGVTAAMTNSSIYSLATTRGGYTANNYLFIGTADGNVYRLKDPMGTAATTATPDKITPSGMTSGSIVTDISVNPRNQDTVMCVVSNYGVASIFWTGNATAPTPTWQTVEGNLTLPSVRACEIVAKTTGVEYYVGTTVGLYSTTNIAAGGTTWVREGSGMIKTAVVNSLAYRWTDNTLVVGTHGNGMFMANIGNAINVTTGITQPIRNDKNFIREAYPTLVNDNISFQVGNMYTIKKLQVQVYNLSGQLIYDRSAGYENGTIPMGNRSAGEYILTVTSSDRKYQFVRKFVKR